MKKYLIIAVVLFSTSSFAGTLIEPYLGYFRGTIEQKNVVGSASDTTGIGYGARLGITFPLIFVALDYSTANVDVKPPVGAKTKADTSMLGLDVGVSSPLGLRAWGGYSFQSQFKDKDSNDTYKGKGFKVGLGYKLPLLPLSLNLEYLVNTYDKVNSVTLSNKEELKALFFSVSAPFNL